MSKFIFIIIMSIFAIFGAAGLQLWLEEINDKRDLDAIRESWEREGIARLQASVESAENNSFTGSTGFH